MRVGRASRTSELVCMGRAFAHGKSAVERYDDPTAFELLPEACRVRVVEARAKENARGMRANMRRVYLERQAQMMVARTVRIDDEVRAAVSPQVVILGAGLDGRAWRMNELADAVVFEVDHPDTQRDKRARVARLKQRAREVHFVPVNFESDRLDDALTKAGHDPSIATTWIWEGVVMYLALADIEATLDVIAKRSTIESRLLLTYNSPALIMNAVRIVLRYIGEPIRSMFTPEQMHALLGKYGFNVTRDDNIYAIGETLAEEVSRGAKATKHQHVVSAAKRSEQGFGAKPHRD